LVLVQEELARASEAYVLKFFHAWGFLPPQASNAINSAIPDSLPLSPSATAVEPEWVNDEYLYCTGINIGINIDMLILSLQRMMRTFLGR
jgi:hypothetical protein